MKPGSAATGLESLTGYRLLPDSPCIDSGTPIAANGGRDFWGHALYAGGADRGAHELPGQHKEQKN